MAYRQVYFRIHTKGYSSGWSNDAELFVPPSRSWGWILRLTMWRRTAAFFFVLIKTGAFAPERRSQMNIRKLVDYSVMFVTLDTLMAESLPQMELYCEIGRLVSGRPEKGAVVTAAEYLCGAYPDAAGFPPRNLRRMREFYRTYSAAPEVLAQAMTIGWTQNVVIMEAELTSQERVWYIRATRQFGWSKLKLAEKIQERFHETAALDSAAGSCYNNDGRGDEYGEKETSGTFLQSLRDEEVQRKLHGQRPCGTHLQNLFPPLTGAAGGGDDAPPAGESAAAPSE